MACLISCRVPLASAHRPTHWPAAAPGKRARRSNRFLGAPSRTLALTSPATRPCWRCRTMGALLYVDTVDPRPPWPHLPEELPPDHPDRPVTWALVQLCGVLRDLRGMLPSAGRPPHQPGGHAAEDGARKIGQARTGTVPYWRALNPYLRPAGGGPGGAGGGGRPGLVPAGVRAFGVCRPGQRASRGRGRTHRGGLGTPARLPRPRPGAWRWPARVRRTPRWQTPPSSSSSRPRRTRSGPPPRTTKRRRCTCSTVTRAALPTWRGGGRICTYATGEPAQSSGAGPHGEPGPGAGR